MVFGFTKTLVKKMIFEPERLASQSADVEGAGMAEGGGQLPRYPPHQGLLQEQRGRLLALAGGGISGGAAVATTVATEIAAHTPRSHGRIFPMDWTLDGLHKCFSFCCKRYR